ncbi:cell division cycle protein [Obelidium mucronatum]|nr:cell division cycle protein [Obelidium mucronatum]
MSFPPLTVQQVMNCSFSSWYPRFKKVTLASEVIPVPQAFLDYLNQDGVFLPLDSNGLPQPSYQVPKNDDDDGSESEAEEEDDDADGDWGSIPHFPEFQEEIRIKIEALGGSVFPKLNWSSPKDASWMALGQTLKCQTAGEIFLLLKSSDFITHDLTCPFEACTAEPITSETTAESYDLVLRKWYDLHPSMEFRCFVKENRLIAISQRDHLNFYPFLAASRSVLESRIQQFYDLEIWGKFFADNSCFTFDVYVNKGNQKVWLIDFNPFSVNTDSLLFTWDEILEVQEEKVDDVAKTEGQVSCRGLGLRVVSDASSCAGGGLTHQPMYATNRLPKDAIDLSDGETLAEFAKLLTEEVARSFQSDDNNNNKTNC